MKRSLALAVVLALSFAGTAAAAEDGGLEIGLDYRFRADSLTGTVHEFTQFTPVNTANPLDPANFSPVNGYDVKNDLIFMNRFGVNLKANPVESVSMKARLVMYKIWGHQSADPALGQFFADRFQLYGTNDGNVSHVPQDSVVRADYAYATVSYLFDQPLWFSVGRRPSTGGVPSNIRQNLEKTGTAGVPSLMVNYAFDGMTVGYAPDIEVLPGAYVKLCYGQGYDSGFQTENTGQPTLRDSAFYGANAAVYSTEDLHIEVQWQKGANIFDAPSDAGVTANLGDITWVGGVVMGKVADLNLFATAALSRTDPNDNLTGPAGIPMAGLMYNAGDKQGRTGSAFYVGARYDMDSTGTKLGVEYNHGSKYWITMVPAEDDIWTGKLGTRGDVYEVYLIQSLNRKPVAKKGAAFIRLGYQLYQFDYTGSNNWIGAPVRISDLSAADPSNAQLLVPLEKAQDIYLTFDVRF